MQEAVAVISIVDDDESSRIGMVRLVRSLGFKALDFSSAMGFLQSPDLISTSCLISDIQMPEMDGIHFLNALRALGHDIPTIFVTAYPNDKIRAQALSQGATCYLEKPLDGETLERCLRVALKNNDKHR